jgi:hypothetical protein
MEFEYNIKVAQSLGHAATLKDHETSVYNFRVTYISSLFDEHLTHLYALMSGTAYVIIKNLTGVAIHMLIPLDKLTKIEQFEDYRFEPKQKNGRKITMTFGLNHS